MGSPCDRVILETERRSVFINYEYNDRNGNELIDPNELICEGRSAGAPCEWNPRNDCFNEDSAKWRKLGTAASFYKRLVAGYSRTSEVKPHEADELFRSFSASMSSGFYERFKKQLERAEASHRKNAARDLDLFIRKGILDFIADGTAGSEVEKKIAETFKVAEDNGVELEKYYRPLTVSLQKAIKRMVLQSKIDGKDRSEYIYALEKLIGAYEPTPPPAPSSEK